MNEKACRLEVRSIFLNKLKNCVENSPLPQYMSHINPDNFMIIRKSCASQSQVTHDGDKDDVNLKSDSCYSFNDYESKTCNNANYSSLMVSYKTEDYLSDSMTYIADSNYAQSIIQTDDEWSYNTYKSLNTPSSNNLRETAKSKCMISAVIDETIKQLSSSRKNDGNIVKFKTYSLLKGVQYPFSIWKKETLTQCFKDQSKEKEKRIQLVTQKEKTNIIRKSNLVLKSKESNETEVESLCCRCGIIIAEKNALKDKPEGTDKNADLCRTDDFLTIAVNDVVNTKVINPMIRKMQRMHLNSLKEEMSLLEDLELLPHKINDIYKTTLYKTETN